MTEIDRDILFKLAQAEQELPAYSLSPHKGTDKAYAGRLKALCNQELVSSRLCNLDIRSRNRYRLTAAGRVAVAKLAFGEW